MAASQPNKATRKWEEDKEEEGEKPRWWKEAASKVMEEEATKRSAKREREERGDIQSMIEERIRMHEEEQRRETLFKLKLEREKKLHFEDRMAASQPNKTTRKWEEDKEEEGEKPRWWKEAASKVMEEEATKRAAKREREERGDIQAMIEERIRMHEEERRREMLFKLKLEREKKLHFEDRMAASQPNKATRKWEGDKEGKCEKTGWWKEAARKVMEEEATKRATEGARKEQGDIQARIEERIRLHEEEWRREMLSKLKLEREKKLRFEDRMAASQPNKATRKWEEDKEEEGEKPGWWKEAARKVMGEEATKRATEGASKEQGDIQAMIEERIRLHEEERQRERLSKLKLEREKKLRFEAIKKWLASLAVENAKRERENREFNEKVLREARRAREREEEEEDERKRKGKGPCSTQ